MKLLAINGSPRRNMNTGQLLDKLVQGAASGGTEAELIHLRDLQFAGCISCFHCKDPQGNSYGRCIKKDDLSPILDKAHEADILVLGTPFYYSSETALMRAFQERLWFQYALYTRHKPPLSPAKKATALLYTMNVKESEMAVYGKDKTVGRAKVVMESLFGPCEVFICEDTKQVRDYSRYEVDIYDPVEKDRRHREVFPRDLERAFALGVKLASDS